MYEQCSPRTVGDALTQHPAALTQPNLTPNCESFVSFDSSQRKRGLRIMALACALERTPKRRSRTLRAGSLLLVTVDKTGKRMHSSRGMKKPNATNLMSPPTMTRPVRG